jgi:hypothetical protein
MLLWVKESEFDLVCREGSKWDFEEDGFELRRGERECEESKVSMGMRVRVRDQQNRNGGHREGDTMFSTSFSGLSLVEEFGWFGFLLFWIGWLLFEMDNPPLTQPCKDYGVTLVHPGLINIIYVALSDNHRDNPMRKRIKLLTITMNENIIW